MLKRIWMSIKKQVSWKTTLLYIGLAYAGVFLVQTLMMKREVNAFLLMEVFGFAVVFWMLVVGTKAYADFLDTYYGKVEKVSETAVSNHQLKKQRQKEKEENKKKRKNA
ncbi:MAG: hypothetical protein HUJ58_05275 [Erysipelotrichaceae bacterium]|nr:hypothetical protein [Erysipelotrichaceae bacterium]